MVTTAAAAPQLTTAQRQRLSVLADLLIPGFDTMRTASAADVSTKWVDVALSHRPDLYPLLEDALALTAAAGDTGASLEQMSHEHPETFDGLTTLIAGAYLMNPDVRSELGYRADDVRHYADDVDAYAEMLERVVERGPTFRRAN